MQENNQGKRTIKTILRLPSQNQNLPKCLSVRNHDEAKLKPNPKRITDPSAILETGRDPGAGYTRYNIGETVSPASARSSHETCMCKAHALVPG